MRTSSVDRNEEIRTLIQEVLFSSPGEDPDRPDFGCSLIELFFRPNSPEVTASMQFTVHAALEKWLGDLIRVENVSLGSLDTRLVVTVDYMVISNNSVKSECFSREV